MSALDEQLRWDPFAYDGPRPSYQPIVDNRDHEFLLRLSRACGLCRMCELGRGDVNLPMGAQSVHYDPHVAGNCAYGARFMVVTGWPGRDELAGGSPLMGDAGKQFNKVLAWNGLTRKSVYVTNLVKCCPEAGASPTAAQAAACSTWLRVELGAVKPKLVAAVGAEAFGLLCPGVDFVGSFKKLVKSAEFGAKVLAVAAPGIDLAAFQGHVGLLCKLILADAERRDDQTA